MSKIFVQIASYRDPELCSTIDDCISKAEFPENLTFAIVNQYSTEDSFSLESDKYKNDSRFNILNVPFNESLGACWARSKTNEMYNGEEFTLQIDSHSRFIKNWDSKLISSWKSINDDKAIYTSYPAPYNPSQDEKDWEKKVYVIHVYGIHNGMTKQRPKAAENWQNRNTPYKARHLAAGFIFGKGSMIKEVPYDPEFYFSGEETSLFIRFYTYGYNLYHPSDLFIWHYYTRKENSKHWNDHKTGHLTAKSRIRLKCLLGLSSEQDVKNFSVGSERSIEDYKKYSGIDLERNILHADTIECKEPPVNQDPESWSLIKKKSIKKLKWDPDLVPEESDISFWAFFVKDCNENTIQRKNINTDKFPDIINKKTNEHEFEIDYYYPAQEPKSFVIWPYSKSKKWIKKSPLFTIENPKNLKDSKNTEIAQDNSTKNYKISTRADCQKDKILIIGSGKSGLDVLKYEKHFDVIVAVNNAWGLTEKWTHWIHPNDYKGSSPEFIKENQLEINANGYGPSLRKYGGIHECGFSIMLNASYWALDNLKPREIYYLGADMSYIPDKDGNTHFYGVGIDIKNRGISDPDLMVKVRSNGDPNYLENIYRRFEKIAGENNCRLFNLSKEEFTRLPYKKVSVNFGT
jgi:hypothetical protein